MKRKALMRQMGKQTQAYLLLDSPPEEKVWGEVFAFVAPKIIGGKTAPSPVGELGMIEMTQALELIDVHYEQVGL
ncbi:unnamed protein product [Ilex paraguariensis]|uniref:DUF2384 domain-containing protein n=1 Tax=Ilex paraguariensis TaxID=185542 RepID=A0ABC8T8S4_9AQUA